MGSLAKASKKTQKKMMMGTKTAHPPRKKTHNPKKSDKTYPVSTTCLLVKTDPCVLLYQIAYPVIGEPPLSAGVVQDKVALLPPTPDSVGACVIVDGTVECRGTGSIKVSSGAAASVVPVVAIDTFCRFCERPFSPVSATAIFRSALAVAACVAETLRSVVEMRSIVEDPKKRRSKIGSNDRLDENDREDLKEDDDDESCRSTPKSRSHCASTS